MPIGDAAFDRALALMKTCNTVICTGVPIGQTNRRMADLIAQAKALGLLRDGAVEGRQCL